RVADFHKEFLLVCWSGWCGRSFFFFTTQAVDAFNQKENHECDDDKANHRAEEFSVKDSAVRSELLNVFQLCGLKRRSEQGRSDNILNQRCYDFPERCTDDHTDSQVHHIALGDKFLEF